MKKLFGLIILLGILLVSCGNAFHTKSSKSDTVDVTLQIPTELLASLSTRQASGRAGSGSNSLEVSLFVNDEEPIVKVIDFSNSAKVSFPDISIGSTVKAKANLKYEGKEYSGESAPAVVTEAGAQLVLVLKQKRSGSTSGRNPNTGRDPNNNPSENEQIVTMYFDDIILSSIPLEDDETIETIKDDFIQMDFEIGTDFSIQGNNFIFTDSGLEKFLEVLAYEDRKQNPYDVLLVYNKRMIGALYQSDKEELLLRLSDSDYEISHSGMVVELKSMAALQQYGSLFVFQEETSGEIINESSLTFKYFDDESEEHERFICTISLDAILDQKHLSEGDTVAFVLKTTGQQPNDIFAVNSVTQFYYQLQEDNWEETYKDDFEGLFINNNCINFNIQNDGKYIFVMPLNFIQDPEDYCKLQFFFDTPEGTSSQDLELLCSVNYYIFPKDTKTFVFGVDKNYDNQTSTSFPYRYVLDLPLNDNAGDMFELEGEELIQVTIGGTVKNYYDDDYLIYTSSQNFTGEVYDGAMYTSSLGSDNTYFHPLSNDQASEMIKTLTVTSGEFSDDGILKFPDIQEPYFDKEQTEDPPHKYRFQFQTPCFSDMNIGNSTNCDPEVLLVIQNFSIDITVE